MIRDDINTVQAIVEAHKNKDIVLAGLTAIRNILLHIQECDYKQTRNTLDRIKLKKITAYKDAL